MVAADSELAGLAPPVPAGSDAVIIIRVDYFLDAALYDERSRGPLDIYASAVMIGRAGDILWQGKGRGEGVRQTFMLRTDDFFPATSRLASSLFASLPPAP